MDGHIVWYCDEETVQRLVFIRKIRGTVIWEKDSLQT